MRVGQFLFLVLLLPVLCFAERKPNVILFVADDFGTGSINAYGAPKAMVRTPNLDRLAAGGMRFENANAPASVCSPTRYAILTGRYAWRGKIRFGVVSVMDPLVIDPTRGTLGKHFQGMGYRTAQIGKWHLGYGSKRPVDFTSTLKPGPNDVGFDYHFGLPQNLDDMLRVWIENDGVYGLRSKKLSPYGKSFYGSQYVGFDAPQRNREEAGEFLTDKAVGWIKSEHRRDPDRPFFLYFASPVTHHPIVPSEEMRGASGCGAYGDFIQDLDRSLGRIVEALEYEGIAGETLIIFTSDNGGDIPKNDDARPECTARDAGLMANGSYRGDKHTIYEGGTRVPLIVTWPGKVSPGTVNDRMVSLVDLYSTLAEGISGEVPSPQEAPDSISFLPSLLGLDQESRAPMVTTNVSGVAAIRDGRWKYIEGEFPDGVPEGMQRGTKSEAKPALYDLETDVAEENNILSKNPEQAQQLQKTLDQYRESGATRSLDEG